MSTNISPHKDQKKRKILIIAPVPPPVHGLSIATKQILDSHLLDKYQIILINSATGFMGEVNRHPIKKLIIYITVLIKQFLYCLIYRPDFLYLTIAQSRLGILRDSFILFIGSLFGCKNIIHLHGSSFRNEYNSLNKFERKMIAFSMSKVSKGIILSDNFSNQFEGLLDKDKIVTINNGIKDTIHRSDLRLKYSQLTGNRIKILFLSNLIPRKGLEDLILALDLLKKKELCYSLLVVGDFQDDGYRTKINKLIDDTFQSNKAIFLGQKVGEDKEHIYEEADLFVFPSRYIEGQPLVIIEAMRAGLPIITSTTGNASKMVTNNQNGLVFNVTDYYELAKKIEEITLDNKKRIEISKNARKTYESYYTDEMFLSKIDKLFIDLLEN